MRLDRTVQCRLTSASRETGNFLDIGPTDCCCLGRKGWISLHTCTNTSYQGMTNLETNRILQASQGDVTVSLGIAAFNRFSRKKMSMQVA